MELIKGHSKAALNWAFRPVRALILAYSYVLTGTKVAVPYKWSDI
ncbi:hypothetical protein vBRpoSV10_126 [Ruegeria phage vB_RpoS-V10]|nr:hypothetical protein vBRpoSV10_126 [Ruegeria phage vB_RpoS-V10]